MEMLSKFTIPGVLFLFTLIFGFSLSASGKPYHGLLFNIHKLIALGCVVLAIMQLSKTIKTGDMSAWLILLLAASALGILALFVSGALMSAGKLDYASMLAIHRIAPIVLFLAASGVLTILQKGGLK